MPEVSPLLLLAVDLTSFDRENARIALWGQKIMLQTFPDRIKKKEIDIDGPDNRKIDFLTEKLCTPSKKVFSDQTIFH